MKKILVLMLLILSIGTTSFGGIFDFLKSKKDKETSEKKESTLVYANFRDLRDLNPHLYGGELFAQNLLFEGLVKIADDGSFQPWLAKSYTVSKDGKTYTFELRDNVTFSDGTKFNAKAAEENFNAILDNYKRHTWLESVRLMKAVEKKGIKPVEATGEYELTIKLADSYYPFLVELGVTRPFRFISPKAFINGTTKNGVSKMSGTGPYILKENHVDEYSVFIANQNYWGKQPEIKKIIAKVIPDSQSRVLALQSGEVDLIYGTGMIDAETLEKFSNMKEFSTKLSKPVSTRMLLMNTTAKSLSDVKVRQAISHATNKEAISKGLFNGIESPADTILSPNVPYANLGLKPYEYSIVKAEFLLDEAGWKKIKGEKFRQKNGKKLTVVLNYDSNEATDKTIAEYLRGEYSKVGIDLELKGEEEQAYRDRMKSGNFDITFNISWGTPYDPQSFLGSMRKPVYGDYFAQKGLSEKAELDKNILEALKSIDENERQKHYKYVLTVLHKEAVYLPLTYERNRAVYNKKVKNVEFNPSKFEVPMEKMNID